MNLCCLCVENEKMRSIRVSNPAFQRSVGNLKGGIEFLVSTGFALDHETQCLVLRSAVDAKSQLEEGLRLLHIEADDLNIEAATRPVVVVPKVVDADFDVYKSQITRMQAQPRGPSVTEVLVGNLKNKQEQLLGDEKPPRNTLVTLPGRPASAQLAAIGSSSDDVEMAEDHSSDSRILISTLRAKRAEFEKSKVRLLCVISVLGEFVGILTDCVVCSWCRTSKRKRCASSTSSRRRRFSRPRSSASSSQTEVRF